MEARGLSWSGVHSRTNQLWPGVHLYTTSLSEHYPWISNISSPWELVRSVDSQATPALLNLNQNVGKIPRILCMLRFEKSCCGTCVPAWLPLGQVGGLL